MPQLFAGRSAGVAGYLQSVAHRCSGCGRRFDGPEAFLAFVDHLDLSVACRHEFDLYLDRVREDAGGA